MSDAEFSTPGGPLRQSLLRAGSLCIPYAVHKSRNNWASPPTDFGTVAHDVFANILKTCRKQKEPQIPTQEAVEIMREVVARSPIVLPFDGNFGLRQLEWQTISFCDHKWPTGENDGPEFLGIEERFSLDVGCPDGVIRTVTGQPDALITDPPSGIICVDWKTGMGKPPEPKDGDFTKDDGKKFLSAQGLFQLYVYGAMLLKATGCEYVILREFHTRWGIKREATIYQDQLEHVIWRIGNHLMKMEQALTEGEKSELWRPKPGAHCHFCPGKYICEVPPEQRQEGAILDIDMALQYAEKWTKTTADKSAYEVAIKGWLEAGGEAPELADGSIVGWKATDKSRRFGVHSVA